MIKTVFTIIFGGTILLSDPFIREQTAVMPDIILQIFQVITRFGDAIFAIPLVLIILGTAYYMLKNQRHRIMLGFMNTVITMLLSAVIINISKILIGRARPKLYEEFGAYYFNPFSSGYDYASFPSGHTMTWALLAFSLAYIFPKYRFLCILSAILVGLSRVILGSHYASDVFFSLIISHIIVFYVYQGTLLSRMTQVRQRYLHGRSKNICDCSD